LKIDWRTRSGKTIIATIVIMTVLVSLMTAVFLALMPTTVVMGKPATLNIKAPMGYETTKQTFLRTFPDFKAANLHYSNPYLGPPEGPSATLTINAGSVSAKAVGTNLHVTADTLDVSVSMFIEGVLQFVQIRCKSLEADVNLWTPDSTGKFGTLVARLKGNVLFHVPNIPGLPAGLAGGYHYEGQSLTITMTFFEPIYTVTVDPSSRNIPQGCKSDFEVTVTPLDPDIKGFVNLRWPDELDKQGIHGRFTTGGGVPHFSDTLTVFVEPWVPTGSYTAQVIAHDWTTGKDFLSNMVTINVEASGFDVTVGGVNPFSTSIQQGMSQGYKIEVTPLTCYSAGMGLYWRPTSGDFCGIGVEMPGGIDPSEGVMLVIKVGSEVPPGDREMDVCVFDGSLKQEFCCHVTIQIVAAGP